MKLPSKEECKDNPLLNLIREDDKKQFLCTRWGANQKFLTRRRILTAFELMKKYLPDNKDIPIADFASGSGTMGLLFAEEGYEVDFLDNETTFFEYIKYKATHGKFNFIPGDSSKYKSEKKYFGIFFGEGIEHMPDPLVTLKNLRENLATGGIICLTTPNGDYHGCEEPSWEEVKNNPERNLKLANNWGNHVCEFRFRELKELVREAGFSLMEHKPINSHQLSRSSFLRRVLPDKILWRLDDYFSKKKTRDGKLHGKTQILVAQRVH